MNENMLQSDALKLKEQTDLQVEDRTMWAFDASSFQKCPKGYVMPFSVNANIHPFLR